MAVDPNKKRVQALYISDDGNSYSKTVHQNHASAGGDASGVGHAKYPQEWTPRVVHGIGSDGIQKATLAVMSPTDPLFTGPTTDFVIAGTGTFQITGRTGEKRPNLGGAPL